MEESGRLESTEWQGVGHTWSNRAHGTGTPGDATRGTRSLPLHQPPIYVRPAPGPGALPAPDLTQHASQWKAQQ